MEELFSPYNLPFMIIHTEEMPILSPFLFFHFVWTWRLELGAKKDMSCLKISIGCHYFLDKVMATKLDMVAFLLLQYAIFNYQTSAPVL